MDLPSHPRTSLLIPGETGPHPSSPGRGVPLNLSDDDEDQDEYITRMLQAAAAGGVDIQWLLQEAQEQMLGEPEYPFETLPTNLKQVADFIQSDKCRKILIL